MRSIDAIVDRHSLLIQAWLVMGPTLIGFYPMTGLINPFWGSLSGFPMYAIARGHPVYGPHPIMEPVAMLLWPLAILAARVWASGKLLGGAGPLRNAVVIVWALSAFAVVPVDDLPRLFPGWPVWCACE